jgi:cbb3-type cytochrome oxidase cytochrome c subunit
MRFFCYVIIVLFASVSLFTGCGSRQQVQMLHFRPDSLPSFTVDVDINRDTVIKTPGGAILRIPANTLDGGGLTHVKLLIKEAYRISDIVGAGLFTNSNGQVLSSGGMIDIEPEPGPQVMMKGSIDISIPTSYVEKNMQLYKGVSDEKGNINWTTPQPLQIDSQTVLLDLGAQLLQTNCGACHNLEKIITGPDLAYIGKRRDKKWLYDYVHDNQKVLASGERYANCLFREYNMTAMNTFPALTDRDLDALFAYVDNESYRLDLPYPDDHLKKCADSCEAYAKKAGRLLARREKLIKKNGQRVSVEMQMPDGYISPDTAGPAIKVAAPEFRSEYYRIRIKTFGWYNIDIELRNLEGAKASQLIVRLTGEYKKDVNIYLVIPSARIFQEGGRLENVEDGWGFYTQDGKIPLPQRTRAIIMAMGEKNGKLAFGLQSFRVTESQTIELEPVPVSKEMMNASIKELDLADLSVQAKDSKNAKAIRKIDSKLQELDALKPKGCDCNCGIETDSSYSTK